METYWVNQGIYGLHHSWKSGRVVPHSPLRLGCALELSYMLLVTINSSENQRASKMTWTKTTKLCTRHHFRTPCYYGFTIETDRSVDRGTFNSQKKTSADSNHEYYSDALTTKPLGPCTTQVTFPDLCSFRLQEECRGTGIFSHMCDIKGRKAVERS